MSQRPTVHWRRRLCPAVGAPLLVRLSAAATGCAAGPARPPLVTPCAQKPHGGPVWPRCSVWPECPLQAPSSPWIPSPHARHCKRLPRTNASLASRDRSQRPVLRGTPACQCSAAGVEHDVRDMTTALSVRGCGHRLGMGDSISHLPGDLLCTILGRLALPDSVRFGACSRALRRLPVA